MFVCSVRMKVLSQEYDRYKRKIWNYSCKCLSLSCIYLHMALTPCFKLSFAWSAISETVATAAVQEKHRGRIQKRRVKDRISNSLECSHKEMVFDDLGITLNNHLNLSKTALVHKHAQAAGPTPKQRTEKLRLQHTHKGSVTSPGYLSTTNSRSAILIFNISYI